MDFQFYIMVILLTKRKENCKFNVILLYKVNAWKVNAVISLIMSFKGAMELRLLLLQLSLISAVTRCEIHTKNDSEITIIRDQVIRDIHIFSNLWLFSKKFMIYIYIYIGELVMPLQNDLNIDWSRRIKIFLSC